jgi:hypothetical protein
VGNSERSEELSTPSRRGGKAFPPARSSGILDGGTVNQPTTEAVQRLQFVTDAIQRAGALPRDPDLAAALLASLSLVSRALERGATAGRGRRRGTTVTR